MVILNGSCPLVWLKSYCSASIINTPKLFLMVTFLFRTLTNDGDIKDRKLPHRSCIQKFCLIYPCITEFHIIDLQCAAWWDKCILGCIPCYGCPIVPPLNATSVVINSKVHIEPIRKSHWGALIRVCRDGRRWRWEGWQDKTLICYNLYMSTDLYPM